MLKLIRMIMGDDSDLKKPIINIGLQVEQLRYDTSHFKPPSNKTVRSTQPQNQKINSKNETEYHAWVCKIEKSPKRKMSHEGIPRAIWFGIEFETEIKLGFLVIDYSGWAHDDSASTIALSKLNTGDELTLYPEIYDQKQYFWPTLFKL